MNYLKHTQYIYLLAGLFFVYDGFSKLNSGTDAPYLSFCIAGAAIVMFFFRRKFAKKFDNYDKKQ
ncbi:hypothetical protein [Flavobacterium sp.]|uniref:hypothetical protein n=1 Tax=Flavobacterium sp. TaxID=239 RepID=UPI003D6A4577